MSSIRTIRICALIFEPGTLGGSNYHLHGRRVASRCSKALSTALIIAIGDLGPKVSVTYRSISTFIMRKVGVVCSGFRRGCCLFGRLLFLSSFFSQSRRSLARYLGLLFQRSLLVGLAIHISELGLFEQQVRFVRPRGFIVG